MSQNFFHTRLRERRSELGITQEQLARAVGRTKGAISHYEKGEVQPPDDTKVALARALKVTPGWLAFGDSDSAGFNLSFTRISGVIASGGRVVLEPGDVVAVPPGFMGDHVLAYIVQDATLAPQIGPGDLIYTETEPMADLEALLGQPAVVELRTGVRILRVVEPSLVPGMVTLTAANAQSLPDVEPRGAYPVIAITKSIAQRLLRERSEQPAGTA